MAQNRYYIPTKADSIKYPVFAKFADKTALSKVCQEKAIVGESGNGEFFGRLKTECYFGKRFETLEQLE